VKKSLKQLSEDFVRAVLREYNSVSVRVESDKGRGFLTLDNDNLIGVDRAHKAAEAWLARNVRTIIESAQ
jgi:hypothetical protein